MSDPPDPFGPDQWDVIGSTTSTKNDPGITGGRRRGLVTVDSAGTAPNLDDTT